MVTRSSRREPLTHAQAMKFIESIREFPVQDVTVAVFRAGVSISRRFRLPIGTERDQSVSRAGGSAVRRFAASAASSSDATSPSSCRS